MAESYWHVLFLPNIPHDPNADFHPGEGWEKRPKSNWANPGRNEGLHPDPNHKGPKVLTSTGIAKVRINYRSGVWTRIWNFWGPDAGLPEGWLLLDEMMMDLLAAPPTL